MKRNNYIFTAIFPFFILASCFSGVKAQTTYENLEKYWLYRDRLDKYFVLIDSDTEKPGTNHPFFYKDKAYLNLGLDANGAKIDINAYHVLSTGDGNDQMQYYIGLLATEYRILQREHQDYTKTRNQLLYALKSIQRFDRNAESYFRKVKEHIQPEKVWKYDEIWPNGKYLYSAHNKGPAVDIPDVNPADRQDDDLNGFMIRNDISAVFIEDNSKDHPFLNNYCTETGGLDGRWDTRLPQGISKDNVWNYLPNLALVKILVDDEEIQKLVKEITTNMIKIMHTDLSKLEDYPVDIASKFILTDKIWAITNPAVDLFVDQGGIIEDFAGSTFSGHSWAFVKAGQFITGEKLHWGRSNSLTAKTDFYETFDFYMNAKSGSERIKHRSKVLNLATVMGDNAVINIRDKPTIMDRLIDNMQNGYSKYEHLPLIRKLIIEYEIDNDDSRNYFDRESFNDANLLDYYTSILNKAPICGPFNLYDLTNGVLPPAPQTVGNPDASTTDSKDNEQKIPYRVADWSVENRLTGSHNVKDRIDETAARLDHLGIFNGIDYMLLHNLVWLAYYDKDADRILHDSDIRGAYDHKSIISDQDIQANEFADYKADYISLEDGFTVEPGGKFDASDRGNVAYSYIYTKSIADANSCFAYRPFTQLINPGNSRDARTWNCRDCRVKSDIELPEQENTFKNICQESDIHKPSTVYPNPTHSTLTVTHALSTKRISVFTNQGVLLQQIENKGLMSETTVDLSDYETGVYYIQVDNGEYHKVVKE